LTSIEGATTAAHCDFPAGAKLPAESEQRDGQAQDKRQQFVLTVPRLRNFTLRMRPRTKPRLAIAHLRCGF
jgi:hypothetical protein